MVHKGTTRRGRQLSKRHFSTLEEKLRRHKNKYRIWRRATKRLAANSNALAA